MRRNTFQNASVVITGASSGIGRATALAYAKQGARLTLVSRDEKRLNAVASECAALTATPNAIVVPGDVADPSTMETAVAAAAQRWDRVDILVNNAGIGHNLPIDRLSWEQITRIINTNLNGVLCGICAALPRMKQQSPTRIGGRLLRGQFINIASIVAIKGIPQLSVYCATKFAVRGLSQSLRIELRRHGIEVICVYPGTTDTDFFDNVYTDGRPWIVEHKVVMSPERVAAAILKASRKHRHELVLTPSGIVLTLSERFFPRLTDWGAARVFDAYAKRLESARAKKSA